MSPQPRAKLSAVYEDDLPGLLRSLGLYGDFASGRLRCAISGDPITEKNLYAIYPHGGQVKVACASADCVAQLLTLQEARPADE